MRAHYGVWSYMWHDVSWWTYGWRVVSAVISLLSKGESSYLVSQTPTEEHLLMGRLTRWVKGYVYLMNQCCRVMGSMARQLQEKPRVPQMGSGRGRLRARWKRWTDQSGDIFRESLSFLGKLGKMEEPSWDGSWVGHRRELVSWMMLEKGRVLRTEQGAESVKLR